MLVFRSFWVSTFVFIIIGCREQQSLGPENYRQWCDQSEVLIQKKVIDDFQFLTKYVPSEYFKTLGSFSPNSIHFQIEMRNTQGGDLLTGLAGDDTYFHRLSYINSSIHQDFKLIVNNKDTLPCVLAHLERTFSIGRDRIILQFEQDTMPKLDNITLQYDDHLFDIGRINVTYDKNKLRQIPILKI